MIAILRTACGCEKAINVEYHFPRQIRVPLYKPMRFIASNETDDDYMTNTNVNTRTFEFHKHRDDGILEYREHV